jgi:hypothetical protein
MIEHLLCKDEVLSSNSSPTKQNGGDVGIHSMREALGPIPRTPPSERGRK